jgi:hypothetical protein
MMTIPTATLGEDAWEFADTEIGALPARIREAFPDILGTVAEIVVGVQTSADDVYILHPTAETPTTVTVP